MNSTDFSLILLDLDKYKVVEERSLPCHNGRKQEVLFKSIKGGKK